MAAKGAVLLAALLCVALLSVGASASWTRNDYINFLIGFGEGMEVRSLSLVPRAGAADSQRLGASRPS